MIKLYSIIYQLSLRLFYKIQYGNAFNFGKHFRFRTGFTVNIKKENAVLNIGNNVFFNKYCSINVHENVNIGNNCIFGEGVKIYDHNHRFKKKEIPINNQDFTTGKVNLGDNCWIGSNTIILKGVQIGNHCVIGAGCVITHDIPDNTIAKLSSNCIQFELIH